MSWAAGQRDKDRLALAQSNEAKEVVAAVREYVSRLLSSLDLAPDVARHAHDAASRLHDDMTLSDASAALTAAGNAWRAAGNPRHPMALIMLGQAVGSLRAAGNPQTWSETRRNDPGPPIRYVHQMDTVESRLESAREHLEAARAAMTEDAR